MLREDESKRINESHDEAIYPSKNKALVESYIFTPPSADEVVSMVASWSGMKLLSEDKVELADRVPSFDNPTFENAYELLLVDVSGELLQRHGVTLLDALTIHRLFHYQLHDIPEKDRKKKIEETMEKLRLSDNFPNAAQRLHAYAHLARELFEGSITSESWKESKKALAERVKIIAHEALKQSFWDSLRGKSNGQADRITSKHVYQQVMRYNPDSFQYKQVLDNQETRHRLAMLLPYVKSDVLSYLNTLDLFHQPSTEELLYMVHSWTRSGRLIVSDSVVRMLTKDLGPNQWVNECSQALNTSGLNLAPHEMLLLSRLEHILGEIHPSAFWQLQRKMQQRLLWKKEKAIAFSKAVISGGRLFEFTNEMHHAMYTTAVHSIVRAFRTDQNTFGNATKSKNVVEKDQDRFSGIVHYSYLKFVDLSPTSNRQTSELSEPENTRISLESFQQMIAARSFVFRSNEFSESAYRALQDSMDQSMNDFMSSTEKVVSSWSHIVSGTKQEIMNHIVTSLITTESMKTFGSKFPFQDKAIQEYIQQLINVGAIVFFKAEQDDTYGVKASSEFIEYYQHKKA